MSNNETISVIIPVYNEKQHVKACLDSILCQTHSYLEVIIVDDGSNDGTAEICDMIAKEDNRVSVVHKQNGGISSARNAGLDVATGAYIGFVDSDDIIEPKTYEILYNAIKRNPHIWLSSCGVLEFSNSETRPYRKKWHREIETVRSADDYINKMFSYEASNTVWNKLFDAKACRNIRFREGYLNEDTVFMTQVLSNLYEAGCFIIEIPDYLYKYRGNPHGITHQQHDRLLIDQNRNLEFILNESHNKPWKKNVQHAYILDTLALTHYLALIPNKKQEYLETAYKLKGSFKQICHISSLGNAIHYLMIKTCPLVYRRIVLSKHA